MPTPSSNPPPDPSSLPSHGFSTCPDDLMHASGSTRQAPESARLAASGVEVRRTSSPEETSHSLADAHGDREPAAPEEVAMLDGDISVEASSRATTMSPRPRSNTTDLTSPAPSGPENDLIKVVDNSETDGPLSRDQAESKLSRRSPPCNTAHANYDTDTLHDAVYEEDCILPSMGPEFPSMRTIPITPSSFLRPGSRFHGTQQSEKQVYEVQVEIKHVDMRESFLCGYLRIKGLTEDHPTLTTYFEGEIIGTKYSFLTQHEEWGANTKVDLSHWSKFSAFRPFQKQARKGPVIIQDAAQKENIFMRWKEHFLVPDHRVRTISGASFEGFYYICFNQIKGEVSGIYFHARSEKFQQLELKHVPDRGRFSAQEFR